ncbi:hypothetical protein FFLO_06240 [Filobasidium floriforme]|uniref:Uncharacterized protein n=1 Tax=Filobasidium floriforme TaxID=5210 RepID=A0A8K0JFB8_9TREE|nr:hypothetical protein FFLO_06240 [Filobasidium floriforme]
MNYDYIQGWANRPWRGGMRKGRFPRRRPGRR